MSVWDNPAEMLSRGIAAREAGDGELAYQMFARASELSPQDPQAWQGRAETATLSDEALVSYAYASALDNGNASLAQRLDSAVSQRVASAEKGDVGLLFALGQELAEVGLTTPADSLFRRTTELDDSFADGWVWLAGTTADAAAQTQYLNRALEINPRDSRARAGLLAINPPAPKPVVQETATPSPATVEAKPAAEDPLTSTDLNAVLAYAALTDNLDEREKLYRHALELDPNNAAALEGLSMLKVKRLREAAPAADGTAKATKPTKTTKAIAPPPDDEPLPQAKPNRMRTVLLVLVVLVFLLALAGVWLMMSQ